MLLYYSRWFVGLEDYRLRNSHKAAIAGIQHRDGSWMEAGGGLMAGPVNAPLCFLQGETSTNISIITGKPGDCQAQSPDVADNMFELLVVKVSSCSSNMDKKPRCHFQARSQPQVAVFS